MKPPYFEVIAGAMNLDSAEVRNTIELLEQGATIPFIARYRKEMTGSLDEVQIATIRDRLIRLKEMDSRRQTILNSLLEQEKLTPELEALVMEASSMAELEDIYLPFKPRRRTRASIAREKGLEPLARIIMSQKYDDPDRRALDYIDIAKGVSSADEAIAGAKDIIAEWVNENRITRDKIRKLFTRESRIISKVVKGKEYDGLNYKNYYEWEEQMSRTPSHRLLAMYRGENEGFLSLSVKVAEENALDILNRFFLKTENRSADYVRSAITDGFKRLLAPSMETEMRRMRKEKADEEAIRVFAENLRQLLMAPPLGDKNVMAIDPGFRTGCKVVCLDRQGKLLHNETIYPHPPENQVKEGVHKIKSLVSAFKIEAIAIGNGTAGRETEMFIRKILFDRDILAVMVNESGASVYSASPIARKEFPDYDVTVRGAVSIGRRLMDPLAELVKIDPKSIGVGQYQHDVDQNALQKSLEDAVESCVNSVGVEANTASEELLTYISGVGSSLAKNIVKYRNTKGPFTSRHDLRKVPRFGDKAFEQAAGFMRIRNSTHPLDLTAVHPESYPIVEKMACDHGCTVEDLTSNADIRAAIRIEQYVTASTGLPTLTDIMNELAKPGRDPRRKFDLFEFAKGIHSIKDLQKGASLPGIVTNITAFGAFVDIGVHQDGLVHISQLADKFVKDPNEVVKLNQKVMVEVMEVDVDRKRISLSMKNVGQ